MEIYEYDEYDYIDQVNQVISVKFIGIGASGASVLNYFSDVGHDIFPARLIIAEENDVAALQDFADGCDWLFVIMDVEDLSLAEKAARIIKITKTSLGGKFPMITFLILCPSADDIRLADIPAAFGTWIILPRDKIAETGLTSNELINRTINVTASPVIKCRIKSLNPRKLNYIFSMDISDVMDTIGNFGRACIGFGESFDAENAPLNAVKKALQSPLFVEDIGKAKKIFLVFVIRSELVDLMKMHAAVNFLDELINHDPEDSFPILYQVLIDETFGDGVTAFVLATNFDFRNGGRKRWKPTIPNTIFSIV